MRLCKMEKIETMAEHILMMQRIRANQKVKKKYGKKKTKPIKDKG